MDADGRCRCGPCRVERHLRRGWLWFMVWNLAAAVGWWAVLALLACMLCHHTGGALRARLVEILVEALGYRPAVAPSRVPFYYSQQRLGKVWAYLRCVFGHWQPTEIIGMHCGQCPACSRVIGMD